MAGGLNKYKRERKESVETEGGGEGERWFQVIFTVVFAQRSTIPMLLPERNCLQITYRRCNVIVRLLYHFSLIIIIHIFCITLFSNPS